MIKIKERYKVTGRVQECDCFWCGYPMYEGDTVVMTNDDFTFCSSTCANKYAKEENERPVSAEVRPVYPVGDGNSMSFPLVSRWEVWATDSNGRCSFVGAGTKEAAEKEANIINGGLTL